MAEQERMLDMHRLRAAEAALEQAEATPHGERVPKVIREEAAECDNCGAALLGPDGMPTRRAWRKISDRLQAEMSSKKRKGKGGQEFDYLDARQVASRLDEVVGPGNWSTQVQVVRTEHPVAVLVALTIFGVTKTDAGYQNNPESASEFVEVRDRDGKPIVDKVTGEVKLRRAEDEPLKAAVSDGFKRAAVQWGVGRWLYAD